MSNLKTLKSRIKSVKSTQKITKAMKMVAASRLKKAKNLVEASRPYCSSLHEMISHLASNISYKENFSEKYPLLTGKGKDKTYLLVVITSDRGLCGGLNSSAVRFAKLRINELLQNGKNVKILCIGKKGYEQLRVSYKKHIIENISGVFKNVITHESAKEIAQNIKDRFDKDEFDICQVVYSKFKSAIAQEPVVKQIIPAKIEVSSVSQEAAVDEGESKMPVRYEPSQEDVLSSLLPRNLTMQIYNELLENSASEQGARMAAMEAATNNASKMIKNLTLVYNRTRQANITRELIDIISGANAV